jgi:NitT/TauT family transport system substrate-binding protein
VRPSFSPSPQPRGPRWRPIASRWGRWGSSDAGSLHRHGSGLFRRRGAGGRFHPFDGAQKMMAAHRTGGAGRGWRGGLRQPLQFRRSRHRHPHRGGSLTHARRVMLFQTLMVRKALIDSGRFKSYADLKGLKVALVAAEAPGPTLMRPPKRRASPMTASIRCFSPSLPRPAPSPMAQSTPPDDRALATDLVNQGVAARFASTEDFYPGDSDRARLLLGKIPPGTSDGGRAISARLCAGPARRQ